MEGVFIYRGRKSYLRLFEGINFIGIILKNGKRDPILMYLLNESVVREVCEFIIPSDKFSTLLI
jgi:hypothetical protein